MCTLWSRDRMPLPAVAAWIVIQRIRRFAASFACLFPGIATATAAAYDIFAPNRCELEARPISTRVLRTAIGKAGVPAYHGVGVTKLTALRTSRPYKSPLPPLG